MKEPWACPGNPILICADDDQTLISLRITLHSAGLTNLSLCGDTRGVWKLLESRSFSLVLLDLTLPCPAGREVLQQAASVSDKPPLVIMTGSTRGRCLCPAAGWALGCLPKPVDRETLLGTVQYALRCPVGAHVTIPRAQARQEE